MENFFKVLAIGAIVFIIILLVVLGLAFGLNYLTQYIPCEILLYLETGVLFIIIAILAVLIIGTNDQTT